MDDGMKRTYQPTFDEISNVWLEPFSVMINCLLPVEYIYGDWNQWIALSETKRESPDTLCSPSPNDIETGSRVEGFCIPQLMVSESDDLCDFSFDEKVYWQPDLDCMTEHAPFLEDSPAIFTVEHNASDPRYVKLRITDEWKEYKPRYKDSVFLNQSFLIPSRKELSIFGGLAKDHFNDEIHGPVVKRTTTLPGNPNIAILEVDNTGVFQYPQAWPEPAMEWLVRRRCGSWPSPELIQDIFESGCHIAPVGRGKRENPPLDLIDYIKDPSQSSSKETSPLLEEQLPMDQTEWRLSFSVAENKLGQSVTPVQRHVLILLKILKKLYFPEVVSSYHLKNLLFWEIENNDDGFWNEDSSAKCLIHMLDRLQQCLENGALSHYIISESNLLQSEDQTKLTDGAAVVQQVRQTILAKSINMFKRITSLTYLSPHYKKGVCWETITSKLSDFTLVENEKNELTSFILKIFIDMCKNIITQLLHSVKNEVQEEKVKSMMFIPIHAYSSLLARCLCKSFLIENALKKIIAVTESEFIVFVEQHIDGAYAMDDEFMVLLHEYVLHAQKQGNLSNVISHAQFMELTKACYAASARQNLEECTACFGSFRYSDLREAERRVNMKYKQKGDTLDNLTAEDVRNDIQNELNSIQRENED